MWSSLMLLVTFLVVSLCGSGPARSQITVEVSPVFNTVMAQTVQVGPNFVFPLELGSLRRGDKPELTLTSDHNKKFIVEFLPRQRVEDRLRKMQSPKLPWAKDTAEYRPFPIEAVVEQDGEYTALIYSDDWWFGTENLNVQYRLSRELSSEERAALQRQFEEIAAFVDSVFVAPAFKIHIGACNEANAFSRIPSGNITYCSELLARLSDRSGAMYGVFFHELGHTLLGLWGLPGATEENMADQFAVYMLLQLKGGIGAADELATYFETSSNPWTHAWQIINFGDTHAIGVQRARNIRQILRDPEEFMERWNRHVYPKMQVANLRRIAVNPRPFESAPAAKEELRARGLGP
jgi:hypothetical protein